MKNKIKEEVVDHKLMNSSSSVALFMQLKAILSFESEGKFKKRKVESV